MSVTTVSFVMCVCGSELCVCVRAEGLVLVEPFRSIN